MTLQQRHVQLAQIHPKLRGRPNFTEDGVPFAISLIPPKNHPLSLNTFTIAKGETEWTDNTQSDGSPSIFFAPPGHITSFHVDPTLSHTVGIRHNGKKVWLFAPPTAENFALLRDMGLPDPLRLADMIPKIKELHLAVTSEDDALCFPLF